MVSFTAVSNFSTVFTLRLGMYEQGSVFHLFLSQISPRESACKKLNNRKEESFKKNCFYCCQSING